MTHYELTQVVLGRGDEEREQMRRLAVHASWSLSPWIKVDASELLGESVSAANCSSPEEFARRERQMLGGR